jgi:amino acid transporter
VLGPLDAACVVVGAIIGVGIFFTPARMAALTRSESLLLLAWALAGAIALCGALAFAELGRSYHASGAQYELLRDSYGPLAAFLFVFCNATAIQAGAIGIIALVCAKHLGVAAAGSEPEGLGLLTAAIALIVLLAGTNMIGARWGSRVQNFTVFAKVAALLAVTALAAFFAPAEAAGTPPPAAPETDLGPLRGVLAALVAAMFSYGGWQQALWIAGEVREPRRNLPRAIIGGVTLVVLVYLLANWAYLQLLGIEGVAAATQTKTLAADAVAVVLPDIGRRLVAAAVAVSAFGVLNSQLLAGPRLIYGMARDGQFFRPFASINHALGTPITSIALLAMLALALLLLAGENGIDRLLTGTVFIDCVFFILTGGAVLILRRRHGTAASTLRLTGAGVCAALFMLGELCVLIGAALDPKVRSAAIIAAVWIAGAAVIYAIWFRRLPPSP